MSLRHGITPMILGAMLLGLGGCGVFGTPSQPLAPPAKESWLIASQGLQKWRISFTPSLDFTVHYLGHPMFSNTMLTLFTRPPQGAHWHRFYTTGPGMVEYRKWGGGPSVRGEAFVGQVKLVVTWMTGKNSHEGNAVYQVRILKHPPHNG